MTIDIWLRSSKVGLCVAFLLQLRGFDVTFFTFSNSLQSHQHAKHGDKGTFIDTDHETCPSILFQILSVRLSKCHDHSLDVWEIAQ